MCYKRIIMDKTRQQKFGYPSEGIPVPRTCHSLNEFLDGEVDCHWHTEFQFGLILKGQVDYWIIKNPDLKIHQTLNAGDGFFINSKVLHSYRQNVPGTEIFIFSVSPDFFASSLIFGNTYRNLILPVLHSPVLGLFLQNGNLEDSYLLELFKTFNLLNPKDKDYDLHSLELLSRLWRHLFFKLERVHGIFPLRKLPALQEQRMKHMLDYIHQHYSEPLTVERIANAGQVSRRECYRCFQASLSQSPGKYLNLFRLSTAAYLLANTSQSLACICEQCGFNNLSYFGKLFRKQYGTTPGQFRVMAR